MFFPPNFSSNFLKPPGSPVGPPEGEAPTLKNNRMSLYLSKGQLVYRRLTPGFLLVPPLLKGLSLKLLVILTAI